MTQRYCRDVAHELQKDEYLMNSVVKRGAAIVVSYVYSIVKVLFFRVEGT
jgi:hypothetical protein